MTEYVPVHFEAVSPTIHADGDIVFMSMLQIEFDHGLGSTAPPGDDPQAMLSWSDDGGASWSNEHWRPIGKKGEYEARAIWRRMGRFHQRIFRLACVGPAYPKVLGADAETTRVKDA